MATVDKREAWRQANAAVDAGRPDDALAHLWALVDRSHVVDQELDGYLRLMGRAYRELGRRRAAATILSFLGQHEAAGAESDAPTDKARAAMAIGRPGDAARLFNDAGWLGHAAIQLEEARDDRGARVLWEQLADDPRLGDDLYTQGLVRFNLGRACERLGDTGAARRAVVQSMHLLEAAADGFETQGLRERAFDCYQVLLTLGRDGAFENLAEGYLNCIRILQEDNLKYYVLQYYEDFQALALKSGELHAAATLFREAAEFTRRHNLPYERYYRQKAAETQVKAAERAIAQGSLAEMAENAYAAAIDAYNDLGAYKNVRAIYGALAQLDLGDKRRARYLRLQRRLEGVDDDTGQVMAFPDYLRMDTAYPEIWRLDVIEWEQDGDPAETMGEVLLDTKWPDFTRRRALLCRLWQLGSGETHLSPSTLVGLAGYLGRVEIYAALSPLEHMADHVEPAVRAAALKAVRQLFFKRSFVLVMRGLRDEDADVRREALEAVGTLHFGHAFDPLQRIFRSSPDAQVRQRALQSIGRIASVEATEMLIDVLRQGDPDERTLARDLLARADHPEADALLRRAASAESGAAQVALQHVLRQRGHR
ncbi:MAG: HEAT repeat domain-containing protein [Myxococcales bacterium]|nr:HEAT repeat domain-containing protein [Myxococcales bacterium]